MECKICGRKAESGFCKLHEESYLNLLESYESWKKSMKISWTDFLKEIQKNPFAGIWVKEVAQLLLASDSSQERSGSAINQLSKV